jgi:hypothetical protein
MDQMQKLSGPVSGVFTSKGPAGQSTGTSNLADKIDPNNKDSVSAYIRSAATARGIDPDIALAVANSEGLNTYVGDNGSSFGPYQLHYGGVASGGNAVSGLGDSFTKQTGLDARNPDTTAAQIDYALDNVATNGWGAFHGAATIGVGGRTGIGSNAKALGSSSGVSSPASDNKGIFEQNSALFNGPASPLSGMYNNQPQLGGAYNPSAYQGISQPSIYQDFGNDPSSFSIYNAPSAQPNLMSRMARPWSVYG